MSIRLMNYSVGQKLWARWYSIQEQKFVMQVPVKVKSIDDDVITVVEDRDDNAIDFNKDGTCVTNQGEWVTSQGEMVRLVERD